MTPVSATEPADRNDRLIARIRHVEDVQVLDAIENILDQQSERADLCPLDDAGLEQVLAELLRADQRD